MSSHYSSRKIIVFFISAALSLILLAGSGFAQQPGPSKAKLGSETAKNGFRNEDEIKAKFEAWSTDNEAREWLTKMGFKLAEITAIRVAKPHDEKADIEVTVQTKAGARTEGISIKLVSSPNGFNQIDKRWVSRYAKMWNMPLVVENALKRFVGEIAPTTPGRAANRMFLDEMDKLNREAVVAFFTTNKQDVVEDLFEGDGPHAARWVMVAFKATSNTRWALKPVDDVIKFYSDGPVAVTSGGNLKIGRITMQRKGGDGGRESAKMLQFKINPALLIPDMK